MQAGEYGDAGEACGGDIEPPGTVAQHAAPVAEPSEAALDDPAAGQHDEAFTRGVAPDDVMAHAVKIGPFAAAVGDEGTIEDGLAQARPYRLAGGVSRSCTEAGTTAMASQWPSASTRATRLRSSTFLPASKPRGPRTAMHY